VSRAPRRALAAVVTAALLLGALAAAQAQVRSVTIGTNPPGSFVYAAGSGVAKVVSGSAPFQMVVQPYAGTSTFLPLLNSGEMDFGLASSVDLGLAYRGPGFKVGGRNPLPHAPHLRTVMRGFPLVLGFLVKKDSPIKTVHDVKGRKVTGEYPALFAAWLVIYGGLASAGLGWDSVSVVPVPSVNEGVDAVVHGRADVTEHSLNSAKIKEADATAGVRHISIDCSTEGERRLRAAVPGYYPRMVKAGAGTGVVDDTCFIAYDYYLATGRAAPDAVVEGTLKAIWDNIEQLAPMHPLLSEWTRERAVDSAVTVPYHPAAVRFYKAKGVWKPDLDDVQKKLLSLNP
jgi:uncharacterized protein